MSINSFLPSEEVFRLFYDPLSLDSIGEILTSP